MAYRAIKRGLDTEQRYGPGWLRDEDPVPYKSGYYYYRVYFRNRSSIIINREITGKGAL